MDWFIFIGLIDVTIFLIIPLLLGIPPMLYVPFVAVYWIWVPRESAAFRSWWGWDYLRDTYFPFSVKGPGAHLLLNPDAKQQYMFGIHPHGVYSVSSIVYFGCNSKLLHVKPVGTSVLFLLPIIKEFVALGGCIRANRSDILSSLACGDSVVLCPGGLRELPGLDEERVARDGGFVRREGFAKIAKSTRVQMVPIYAHGEDDLYGVYLPWPWMQRLMLSWIWYCPPVLSWGNRWVPFWPKGRPVELRVGRPTDCVEDFYRQLAELRDDQQ
jgi:hypothetical protein